MLVPVPLLLARLPDHPSLLEKLGYQLNGVLVVFLALASIWLALEIVGKIFKREGAAPSAVSPAPAPAAAVAPTPAIPSGIAPELLAAITVAVHVTLGERVRISAIVPVGSQAWAREGRRQIFSSHQPR